MTARRKRALGALVFVCTVFGGCGPSPSAPLPKGGRAPIASASASATPHTPPTPPAPSGIRKSEEPVLVVQRDGVVDVRRVSVSPSGSLLAITGHSLAIRRHEGDAWPLVAVYSIASEKRPGRPSWSYDGTWLALSVGRRAYALEVATGSLHPIELAPGDEVTGDVSFRPSGDSTLAIPMNGGIKVWAPGSPLRSLSNMRDACARAVWSPDGRAIAVTTTDENVLVDATTGEVRRDRFLGTGPLLAWSADGKTLAYERTKMLFDTQGAGGRPQMPSMAGEEQQIALVELGGTKPETTLKKASRWGGAFAPNGRTFLFGSKEDPSASMRLEGFDVATQERRLLFSAKGISAASWMPTGESLVVGFEDGAIQFVEAASGQARTTIEGEPNDVFSEPVFSEDGSWISALSGREGKLSIVQDLRSGALRKAPARPPSPASLERKSKDGQWIASRSKAGALQVRDAKASRPHIKLADAHGAYAWTADSKALVFSDTKRIVVWDAVSGEKTRTFSGVPDGIDFAVAPAGKLLAYTSWSTSEPRRPLVNIVDVSTGEQRASIPISIWMERPVLGWSRSGDVLAIGGLDVLLYRVVDGAMLHLASFRALAAGLAWTDEGLFDGDEAAFTRLLFRVGSDLGRAALKREVSLLHRYHHPHLVAEFLAGATFRAPMP